MLLHSLYSMLLITDFRSTMSAFLLRPDYVKLLMWLLISACLMFVTSNVFATGAFLAKWREAYPNSTSSDINCQLCHRNETGNNPWNAYGWAIRTEYNLNGRDILGALDSVANLNSDEDPSSLTNEYEISLNEQPGWRSGKLNKVHYCDGFNCDPYFLLENPPAIVDPYPLMLAEQKSEIILAQFNIDVKAIGAAVAPGNPLENQLFIYQQEGLVWRTSLPRSLDDAPLHRELYLDLNSRLLTSLDENEERGLLGLAFHPNFGSNGLIYIHTSQISNGTANYSTLSNGQSADHQSVVIELSVAQPLNKLGAAKIVSEREILRIDQPQKNHNGGGLLFDNLGLLYLSFGDGGGMDDQGVGHAESGNAQDLTKPLGKVLRIDPLGSYLNNGRYGIPIDNPFVMDASILNEIYAYGFRDPKQLTFDADGTLVVADSGNFIEEVNLVQAGGNYGWKLREGSFYFDDNDQRNGLILINRPDSYPELPFKLRPLFSYDHEEGNDFVGGYFYQGESLKALQGYYIFADAGTNRIIIGDLNQDPALFVAQLDIDFSIEALIVAADKELYILGRHQDGSGMLVAIAGISIKNDDMCFPIINKNDSIAVFCL